MRFSLEFKVPFVAGKERPRHANDGHVYTPAKTQANECEIWDAYTGACIQEFGRVIAAPKGVPVGVEIHAFEQLPKRCKVSRPFVKKPDADNIAKLICDGLNPGAGRAGAWADDSQVTQLNVLKLDGTKGVPDRTYVTVRWEEVEDGR